MNENCFKSPSSLILHFTLMRQYDQHQILNLTCSLTSLFLHLNSGDDQSLMKDQRKHIYFWRKIFPIALNKQSFRGVYREPVATCREQQYRPQTFTVWCLLMCVGWGGYGHLPTADPLLSTHMPLCLSDIFYK